MLIHHQIEARLSHAPALNHSVHELLGQVGDDELTELVGLVASQSSGADTDVLSTAQPVTTMAPIQSTVPAVRHVPTLISGLTKPGDGLLGPANIPHPSATSTGASSGSNMTGSSYNNPFVQLGSKSGSNLCGRSMDVRKSCLDVQSSVEADEPTAYSHVPIDAAVSLVLSRLRRAQSNCNALVTSNQTELQSFTFTQNSQNGKLIMMRVRVLEQENDELASINRTGRAARLETEIALRRRFVQDLKQTHSGKAVLFLLLLAETVPVIIFVICVIVYTFYLVEVFRLLRFFSVYIESLL
ncbi:unnamed protein product [Echinostoma caproni]|uniref:Uncharacterized protein n=1 Tax=Echinostoma caproni TaxID=27848 RepID=A0A183ASW5_9TREM|nr:unnamed protein product [Echinostoma caproni]